MRVPRFRGKNPQGLCALRFVLKHTLSVLLTTLLPTSIPLHQAIAFIVTHLPQTHRNKSQPLDLNPNTTQTLTNPYPNADPNTTQSPPPNADPNSDPISTQTPTQTPPNRHPECRFKHHPVATPNADPNTTQIRLKRQPNFDPNPPNDNHNYLFLL